MNKKPHILLVEDEVHLATGIKYNLEAEGYQVHWVGDGPSALRLLEDPAHHFDLVILDLMLPGMSGYAVCETLRAEQNDIPVLILTARTLPEDRIRGFDVGADQYLTKPFDLDEFLIRVRNLLHLYTLRREKRAETPAPEPRVFRFGDAVVNFDTFEVQVRNQSVRLTHLEMKLLRYFIENAGRVISRKELLEKVWELPGYLATRAPDQFIRRLRKIFEPNPSRPRYFLTIRDAGYRFVPSGSLPVENSPLSDSSESELS